MTETETKDPNAPPKTLSEIADPKKLEEMRNMVKEGKMTPADAFSGIAQAMLQEGLAEEDKNWEFVRVALPDIMERVVTIEQKIDRIDSKINLISGKLLEVGHG